MEQNKRKRGGAADPSRNLNGGIPSLTDKHEDVLSRVAPYLYPHENNDKRLVNQLFWRAFPRNQSHRIVAAENWSEWVERLESVLHRRTGDPELRRLELVVPRLPPSPLRDITVIARFQRLRHRFGRSAFPGLRELIIRGHVLALGTSGSNIGTYTDKNVSQFRTNTNLLDLLDGAPPPTVGVYDLWMGEQRGEPHIPAMIGDGVERLVIDNVAVVSNQSENIFDRVPPTVRSIALLSEDALRWWCVATRRTSESFSHIRNIAIAYREDWRWFESMVCDPVRMLPSRLLGLSVRTNERSLRSLTNIAQRLSLRTSPLEFVAL